MMKEQNNDDYFEKEKPSVLRTILGLLTFTTIIPLNIYTTIDEMAKMTWIWPLINGLVGVLGFIICYILYGMAHFDSLLVATIAYAFFIWINGFNHLDGLIDFGDGIMVHGDAEKKLAIMKDPIASVGGIASMFIVGVMTIACYNSIITLNYLLLIIIAEMCAKVGLITCCVFSKPAEEGIGKFFIEYMTINKFFAGAGIAILLAALISYPINAQIGVWGVIGAMFGGTLTAGMAQKHLGFSNGDVLGTSNEIGRLFSLLFMIFAITTLI